MYRWDIVCLLDGVSVLGHALILVLIYLYRWRECVSDTDNVLGFALGAMFINSTFNKQSKPEAESMIKVKYSIENLYAHTVGELVGRKAGNKLDLYF